MTSDARPKLNFAGPFCVIEQSEKLTVLEITPEGLGELVDVLLNTHEEVNTPNLRNLTKILEDLYLKSNKEM